MIDAASGIMAEQETLLDLQRALTALAADEAARRGALEAERGRLARLLGGLQRLARVPPEALAARPGAPLDTVRSALLLRAAVPALEARAAALRRDLTDLAALRRDLMVRRARAEAVRARLNADIAGLSALADRRAQLLAMPPAEPERTAAEAQALAGGAGTLHELLQRVAPDGAEQARDTAAAALAAPPAARTAAGRSTALRTDAEAAAVEPQLALLPPPAAPAVVNGVMLPAGGTVILGYGEPDMFGAASRGLVLQVYPGAPVVAPLDGLVRFAGPFRGYGDILILEHRGGYHTLVAGFGRINVRVGQEVLGGEPVGVTPSPQTGAREAPTLYFEFRRNGQPIDPLLGLAAAQGRG